MHANIVEKVFYKTFFLLNQYFYLLASLQKGLVNWDERGYFGCWYGKYWTGLNISSIIDKTC